MNENGIRVRNSVLSAFLQKLSSRLEICLQNDFSCWKWLKAPHWRDSCCTKWCCCSLLCNESGITPIDSHCKVDNISEIVDHSSATIWCFLWKPFAGIRQEFGTRIPCLWHSNTVAVPKHRSFIVKTRTQQVSTHLSAVSCPLPPGSPLDLNKRTWTCQWREPPPKAEVSL